MTYILILFVGYGTPGGPTTAEFHSKASCDAALAVIKDEMTNAFVRGVCVPK